MYTYDCGTSGPYINYREVFARYTAVNQYITVAIYEFVMYQSIARIFDLGNSRENLVNFFSLVLEK